MEYLSLVTNVILLNCHLPGSAEESLLIGHLSPMLPRSPLQQTEKSLRHNVLVPTLLIQSLASIWASRVFQMVYLILFIYCESFIENTFSSLWGPPNKIWFIVGPGLRIGTVSFCCLRDETPYLVVSCWNIDKNNSPTLLKIKHLKYKYWYWYYNRWNNIRLVGTFPQRLKRLNLIMAHLRFPKPGIIASCESPTYLRLNHHHDPDDPWSHYPWSRNIFYPKWNLKKMF